jgi:hypothetical protein
MMTYIDPLTSYLGYAIAAVNHTGQRATMLHVLLFIIEC